MKLFATIAAIVVFLPLSAGAFQIVGPGQLAESGLNLSERGYFSHDSTQTSQSHLQIYGGDQYHQVNSYGRYNDGSGRYLGDNWGSKYRACPSDDSNIAKLDAMSGGGYSYPCQRFR